MVEQGEIRVVVVVKEMPGPGALKRERTIEARPSEVDLFVNKTEQPNHQSRFDRHDHG